MHIQNAITPPTPVSPALPTPEPSLVPTQVPTPEPTPVATFPRVQLPNDSIKSTSPTRPTMYHL